MIPIEIFIKFITSINPLSWDNIFAKLKSKQNVIDQEMKKYMQCTKSMYEYSNQFKGDIFEYLSKYLLIKNGYKCWLYNSNESTEIKSRLKLPIEDTGLDMIALKDDDYYCVQCKFISKETCVPLDKVNHFEKQMNKPGITGGIIISTSVSVTQKFEQGKKRIEFLYNPFLKENICMDLINVINNENHYCENSITYGFNTFRNFECKKFRTIDSFCDKINCCVFRSTFTYLLKIENPSINSDFKFIYSEKTIIETKQLLNDVIVYIRNTNEITDETTEFKKYTLWNALKVFPLKQFYSGFIFDPSFKTKENITRNGNLIFNTFQDIPYILTSLSDISSESYSQLFVVNKYIEDICGKERNPKSYKEYYDYLLNYMSWIFANKRSSGVMILLVGDQGEGKTLLSNFIADIFTREYSCNTSNNNFFMSNFNSHIRGKLIITIDEFKMLSKDRFKDLVEKKQVRETIQKGKDSITVETFENYIATSNSIDQQLSCQDRRVCVINSGYKIDSTYAAKVLVPILQNRDFQNTFRNILVKRWENIKDTFDVSKFPVSKLKLQMSENSFTDFERYLIKEYYNIKSEERIIFSDFKKGYENYIDEQKPLSNTEFKRIYSNYDNIGKKKLSVKGKCKYVLHIKNINRLYSGFIDSKMLPKLCIEYNEGCVSNKMLFNVFSEENTSKPKESQPQSIDIQQTEIPLLDKLLFTKSNKDNIEKSYYLKLIDSCCKLITSYDESKLTKEQKEALAIVAQIKF